MVNKLSILGIVFLLLISSKKLYNSKFKATFTKKKMNSVTIKKSTKVPIHCLGKVLLVIGKQN